MIPWWFAPLYSTPYVDWSGDEVRTSTAIYSVALISWTLLNVVGYWFLARVGLAMQIVFVPAALCASRWLVRFVWPGMVK